MVAMENIREKKKNNDPLPSGNHQVSDDLL